jgi:hypothetical protein
MDAPRFVRAASQDERVQWLLRDLFDGIRLDEGRMAEARRIVAGEVRSLEALPREITDRVPSPLADTGTMIPGFLDRALELADERDEMLRSLLATDEERKAFDANAGAERRKLGETRRPLA